MARKHLYIYLFMHVFIYVFIYLFIYLSNINFANEIKSKTKRQ